MQLKESICKNNSRFDNSDRNPGNTISIKAHYKAIRWQEIELNKFYKFGW